MWQLEAGSWTNILLMSSMWQFPKKQQRNTKPLTIAQSCTFLLSKKAKTWSPNQGSWLRWQNVCSANPHQSLNNTSLSVPKPQDMKCQNMYEAILSGYWLLCFFFQLGYSLGKTVGVQFNMSLRNTTAEHNGFVCCATWQGVLANRILWGVDSSGASNYTMALLFWW